MLSFTSSFIKVPLHPINYCAFVLVLSISLGYSLFLWVATGMFIVGSMFLLPYKHSQWWSIIIVLAYLGGVWRHQSCINDHYAFIKLLDHTPCTLKGTIISIDSQDSARTKQKITLQTDYVELPGQSKYYVGKTIQIYLVRPTEARVADEIEIHDFCIKKNKNESYEQYLIKENIAATVFLPSLEYSLIYRPHFSLSRGLFYFKKNLLARCKKKLSRIAFSFFASVFLGNKMHEKKQMEGPKDNCKTWGISHYLARSGLHMIIFIYIWHLLLSMLPIPFSFKQIVLIGLGVLYHILSWPSISFIRAFMSFLLFKSCTLLQVPSQLLHLLSLVTIGVLLHNPMQLFFLDFQLSFGLTFALAWFNHVTTQKSCLATKY